MNACTCIIIIILDLAIYFLLSTDQSLPSSTVTAVTVSALLITLITVIFIVVSITICVVVKIYRDKKRTDFNVMAEPSENDYATPPLLRNIPLTPALVDTEVTTVEHYENIQLHVNQDNIASDHDRRIGEEPIHINLIPEMQYPLNT